MLKLKQNSKHMEQYKTGVQKLAEVMLKVPTGTQNKQILFDKQITHLKECTEVYHLTRRKLDEKEEEVEQLQSYIKFSMVPIDKVTPQETVEQLEKQVRDFQAQVQQQPLLHQRITDLEAKNSVLEGENARIFSLEDKMKEMELEKLGLL